MIDSALELQTKIREDFTITFNQERALVGAFSVIVKSSRTFVLSCSIQMTSVGAWVRLELESGAPHNLVFTPNGFNIAITAAV